MSAHVHDAGAGMRSRPVTGRILAGVAAGLGALFVAFYLGLMAQQESLPSAWWYAAAIAVPVVLCVVAAVTGRVRVLTAVAAVLFGALAVLGLLSIGALLLPATLCAAISAAIATPTRVPSTPNHPVIKQ